MQIESCGQCRQSIDHAIVSAKDNVLDFKAGRFGGTAGSDVRNHDSPALSEPQTFRQCRRNGLRASLDFDAMHMPVLAQALIDEADDASGNCESQTFAS